MRVDGLMGEQPFHRPLAGPGEAVLHLFRLLGDMDMDRRRRILGAKPGDRGAQHLRCGGAQRMRRDADADLRIGAMAPAEDADQLQEALRDR